MRDGQRWSLGVIANVRCSVHLSGVSSQHWPQAGWYLIPMLEPVYRSQRVVHTYIYAANLSQVRLAKIPVSWSLSTNSTQTMSRTYGFLLRFTNSSTVVFDKTKEKTMRVRTTFVFCTFVYRCLAVRGLAVCSLLYNIHFRDQSTNLGSIQCDRNHAVVHMRDRLPDGAVTLCGVTVVRGIAAEGLAVGVLLSIHGPAVQKRYGGSADTWSNTPEVEHDYFMCYYCFPCWFCCAAWLSAALAECWCFEGCDEIGVGLQQVGRVCSVWSFWKTPHDNMLQY